MAEPGPELAAALTALDAEGEAVPLLGGITNHNFRVRLPGDVDAVLRLAGGDTDLLGISRVAELEANEAAAAMGIAPDVITMFPGGLVTRFVESRPVDAAALRADPTPIAHLLRRFHDEGPDLPVRFWVPELIEAYVQVVLRRGSKVPDEVALARESAARVAEAVPLTDARPCHNDLLLANLLDAGDRLVLVDWEYAGMGHRLFDLGNLAVNNDFDEAAQRALLHAYYGDDDRLPALRLMRVMSDAREAMWGLAQYAISRLDFDFRSYADRHFARLRAATEDPQFAADLQEAARGPAA